MFKKLNNLKKDKKGFTLVELIVVLVILAILMAVLIPALLGWIDKARNSQITTNANAALVAAQGLADEAYGLGKDPTYSTGYVTWSKIKSLTDITATTNPSITVTYSNTYNATGTSKKMYKISGFKYVQDGKTAEWSSTTGNWTVTP
ncbi:MAG: type II secretion system GspH family protein [Butyrivibrio sp.]|nr:type II secretion system GspH family protein [Butyrivibrio sp.]